MGFILFPKFLVSWHPYKRGRGRLTGPIVLITPQSVEEDGCPHWVWFCQWFLLFYDVIFSSFCLIMQIYLFDRELNNMGIWYRMGNVPRTQDSTHTPTTNNIQNVNSSSSSAPVPAAPMPKYVDTYCVCVLTRDARYILARYIIGPIMGIFYCCLFVWIGNYSQLNVR